MKANIFCNVCKSPLRAVKEYGKNEVDLYVVPCEKCAAQQKRAADLANAPRCKECGKEYGENHDDLCLEKTPSR